MWMGDEIHLGARGTTSKSEEVVRIEYRVDPHGLRPLWWDPYDWPPACLEKSVATNQGKRDQMIPL